jgi:hypothetical protein
VFVLEELVQVQVQVQEELKLVQEQVQQEQMCLEFFLLKCFLQLNQQSESRLNLLQWLAQINVGTYHEPFESRITRMRLK